MKVIYIAGPYRGENAWVVKQNIRAAEEAAYKIAEMGASFICPHTNTRFFNGTLTDKFWLDATMELLRRCDAVYCLSTYHKSEGAMMEIIEAKKIGVPVFQSLLDVGDFLEEGNEQ